MEREREREEETRAGRTVRGQESSEEKRRLAGLELNVAVGITQCIVLVAGLSFLRV